MEIGLSVNINIDDDTTVIYNIQNESKCNKASNLKIEQNVDPYTNNMVKKKQVPINCSADNWGDQLSSGIIYPTIDTKAFLNNDINDCKILDQQISFDSIDSIIEEFYRIKEEIKSFDIYFEPSITASELYHPQCQNYMKHLGSDGDIDLSNTKLLHHAEYQQYMQYLGSDGDINLRIKQYLKLLGSDGDVNLDNYKPCNHYKEQIILQSSNFLWNNDILFL